MVPDRGLVCMRLEFPHQWAGLGPAAYYGYAWVPSRPHQRGYPIIQHIGKYWTDCFTAQCPELRIHFSCIYDYQRVLQEDLDTLMHWFYPVENMCAKYGIVDSDFYNFDKMDFAMGMIQATLVVTHADQMAKPKAIAWQSRMGYSYL